EFDVTDDVIDKDDADRFAFDLLRRKSGQERTGIVVAVVVIVRDQRMDRVAVGRDGRVADRAVLVRPIARFGDRRRTAFYGFGKCLIGVFYQERDVANAVA